MNLVASPRFILIVAVVAWESADLAGGTGFSIGSACDFPDGSEGNCALLDDCLVVKTDFRKNGNDTSRSEIFRTSHSSCGLSDEDGTPIVCCVNTNKAQRECEIFKVQFKAISKNRATPSSITQRVVNGEEADPHEFPHMVALGYRDEGKSGIQWSCGGILISKNRILTAAHCGKFSDTRNLTTVRLGAHNVSGDAAMNGDTQFEIQRKDFIMHPRYRSLYAFNDIAIIKIPNVRFNDRIFPACLHTEYQVPQTTLSVAGWGLTEGPSGSLVKSDVLRKADVQIKSDTVCRRYQSKRTSRPVPEDIFPKRICARGINGADTHEGDSGGPLQFQLPSSRGMYSVVGITSRGWAYTRVSSYLDWIESQVWSCQSGEHVVS